MVTTQQNNKDMRPDMSRARTGIIAVKVYQRRRFANAVPASFFNTKVGTICDFPCVAVMGMLFGNESGSPKPDNILSRPGNVREVRIAFIWRK
jgi:hypothetical protein